MERKERQRKKEREVCYAFTVYAWDMPLRHCLGHFTAFSYLLLLSYLYASVLILCTALAYFCRLRSISIEPSDVRLARV